jgi:hypothetical protein
LAAAGGLDHVEGLVDAVSVAGNFLGPLLILKLAGGNYYLILLVNTALMFASLVAIARSMRIDQGRFCLVVFANPLTLSSMLSVNKEVLAVAFLALLLMAYRRKSLALWLLAVFVSLMVRWQTTLFMLALSFLLSRANPLVERRTATTIVTLVVLSIIYVQLAEVFEPIRFNFEQAAQEYEGSGLYEWMIGVQDAGYYWLIFPFKAAHLLFGMGLRFDRLLNPTDAYNDGWQLLHSTALLVLFGALVRSGRFRLDSDLIYISLIYLVVFVITPIYTPRYFYPVYVLWAAAWASGRHSLVRLREPAKGRNGQRPRKARLRPAPQPAGAPFTSVTGS